MMRSLHGTLKKQLIWLSHLGVVVLLLWTIGCASPARRREAADRDAYAIIARQQEAVWGSASEFRIETPADTLRRRLMVGQDLPRVGEASLGTDALEPVAHWPETHPLGLEPEPMNAFPSEEVFSLNMLEALQVGAANNRDYQQFKEEIFRAALALDVEQFEFANQFSGTLEGEFTDDRSGEEDVRGWVGTATAGVSRTLRTGAALSTRIMLDVVQLLTLDRESVYGLMADVSISIPLLRGAGRHVVTEPLTQAERNVAYALKTFEQFRRQYAVRVTREYLQVLQSADQVQNARENFERVGVSAQRARRLAEAGRLPEIQVDQALQEELRARDRWLSARVNYERQLDQFKSTLGLPVDARVSLDSADLDELLSRYEEIVEPRREELAAGVDEAFTAETLTAESDLRTDIPAARAIQIALQERPDMIIALGRVVDAQRGVVVGADGLRWRAMLTGGAQAGSRRGLGSVAVGDSRLDPSEGRYSAGLEIEVPWSRRAARNAYRERFIALDRAVRAVQELEDSIKAEVRQSLRVLLQSEETMAIQAQSVALAHRRVDSTDLFLQAGRAQIRDVLEAEDALVSARNALTAAVVTYRLAELELQRDMGILMIDETGLWQERELSADFLQMEVD